MSKYLFRNNSTNQVLQPQLDNYARPDNRVEYQLFSSEYFSNADVKLYFGDIWVDDITAIQFTLQEEVMPIYGYHSYTYDAMLRGKRIINGSFSINFTTSNYLQKIIQHSQAIAYAIEQGEKTEVIDPSYYKDYNLAEILEKLGKNSFTQLAEEYEKAVWGDDAEGRSPIVSAQSTYFRQNTYGFDVRIHYGTGEDSMMYPTDRFYAPSKEIAAHAPITVDTLNGVQVHALSKSISTQDQGMPIQEHYAFMARDLNGPSLSAFLLAEQDE